MEDLRGLFKYWKQVLNIQRDLMLVIQNSSCEIELMS